MNLEKIKQNGKVKTMFVTRLNNNKPNNAGLPTNIKTVALGGTGGNDKERERQ